MAQDTFRPKYVRDKGNALQKLASDISENGWITFRKDAKVDPDAFFKTFGDQVGLGKGYQMRLLKDETDLFKVRHQRFLLYYKDIPVESAEFSLHSRNNQLQIAHGRIVENLDLAVDKRNTEDKALDAALADQKLTRDIFTKKNAKLPKGELLIARVGNDFLAQNFRLCYAFDVQDAADENVKIDPKALRKDPQRVYVDAQSSAIIRRDPLEHHCFSGHRHQSDQPGNDADLPEVSVPPTLANAPLTASTFVPWWPQYLNGQSQLTFETELFRNPANNQNEYRLSHQNGALITRRDVNGNDSWAGNPDVFNGNSTAWGSNVPVATTAHWLTQRVYQFFQQFASDQNGIDRAGTYPRVLVDARGVQASWSSRDRQITFGIAPFGPNDINFVGNPNVPLMSADIVGHEYTHAITSNNANLEYRAESGALNESFSDIFGTAFERFLFPNDWDWNIGEDSYQLRDMANPQQAFPPFLWRNGVFLRQPQIYLGADWHNVNDGYDNAGVHINSGVLNKWFFLLSQGGSFNGETVTGIGVDRAANIAYFALRYYLQRASTYPDARSALMGAATFMYGACSPEQRSVSTALRAVGLAAIDCSPPCDFALTPVTVNATCGQTVTLTTTCSGPSGESCNDLTYSWTTPNIIGSANGPTVTITAPSSGGQVSYRVTATKPEYCLYSSSGAQVTLNVSCAAPSGSCDAFTVGTVVGYGASDPSLGVMVGFDGTCKRAMWANGTGLTPVDWKPYVVPTGNFTTASINQCLRYGGEACGGGTTPPAGTRCAAFTNGTLVASWTGGDPGYFTVRVRDIGTCRQAIWGNGDPVLTDWKPYLTAKPGFTLNDVFYCLNFDGNCNNGRPDNVRPPATAFGVKATTGTTDESPARVSSGEPAPDPNELVAYPNPASEVLTVNLGYALPANPTFTLTDVLGRTHETGSRLSIVGGQRIRLSVRSLPTGVYVLRIAAEGIRPRTVRFVKE